jgi:hypothetical protein
MRAFQRHVLGLILAGLAVDDIKADALAEGSRQIKRGAGDQRKFEMFFSVGMQCHGRYSGNTDAIERL